MVFLCIIVRHFVEDDHQNGCFFPVLIADLFLYELLNEQFVFLSTHHLFGKLACSLQKGDHFIPLKVYWYLRANEHAGGPNFFCKIT